MSRAGLTIFGLVSLCIVTFGYIYYLEKDLDKFKYLPSSSIVLSPSENSNSESTQNLACADFIDRFGLSANELVNFINDEPDSAVVMKGYRNLHGTILGITGDRNLPLYIQLDESGKIVTFECRKPDTKPNSKTDITFTLPETDFAQLIRYRETLETEQTATYLQNMTTEPQEAKRTIMQRIQQL